MLAGSSSSFKPAREVSGGIPSFKVFIQSLWVGASGGGTLGVDSSIHDPVIARVPDSSSADVDAAIDGAVPARAASTR